MINLGYWDQFDGGVKFSAYIYNVGVLTGETKIRKWTQTRKQTQTLVTEI